MTCAVRYAAELEIFPPRQGEEDFDRAPLQLEVSLGRSDFREGPTREDVGFSLQFRRVIVELFLENAEIALDGRYVRNLENHVFKRSIRRTVEDLTSRGAERGGGIALALNRILAALKIEGNLKSRLIEEIKHGNFDSIESAPPFPLVRYASGRRWEIGDAALGDPSQTEGVLHGSYLYAKQDAENELAPLCYLTPLEDKPFAVTVELRAGLKDCVYSPLGAVRNEARWKQRNREIIERRLVTKMLQEQNRSDGYDPPPGEVILARGRIEFAVLESGT